MALILYTLLCWSRLINLCYHEPNIQYDSLLQKDKSIVIDLNEDSIYKMYMLSQKKEKLSVISKWCYIYSPKYYEEFMNIILKHKKEDCADLYGDFIGSLLSAPNEDKYDKFLRSYAENNLSNQYTEKYHLYDSSVLIIGLRKTLENKQFLKNKKNKYFEGIHSQFVRDALENINFKPCIIDTNNIDYIDKEELFIITNMFSNGIVGIKCLDNDINDIYDFKMRGYWHKSNERWVFYYKGRPNNNSKHINIVYAFHYSKSRDVVFVDVTLIYNELNFIGFTYRYNKINNLYKLTGLWFRIIG